MKIDLLTIFPQIFSGFLSSSLIEKSITKGAFSVKVRDIRDFASPPHNKVDDTPYGGGAGMVMMPQPLALATEAIKKEVANSRVILLSPSGKQFKQEDAERLSKLDAITLVCGRYEGVDQRFIENYVDEELSIGDFVLMGGEVPAMALIESIVRLIPGVIGNSSSTTVESFSMNESTGQRILEGAQYTRPEVFEGKKVPDVLLSGDHKAINKWRDDSAIEKTKKHREDLLR